MLINLLIPSGSAKAAIVMPIIIPIAEIVGLTAQTAVLAYQLGDGITNMCGFGPAWPEVILRLLWPGLYCGRLRRLLVRSALPASIRDYTAGWTD